MVSSSVFGDHETSGAADEAIHVHDRGAIRCFGVARPLDGAEFVQSRVRDARETWGKARHLVHDLAGVGVGADIDAERVCQT